MPLVNLNKQLDRGNSKKHKGSPSTKIILGLLLLLLTADLYFPIRAAYQASKAIKDGSKVLLSGVKQNNLGLIKQGADEIKASVDATNSALVWLLWLKAIPFVGSYYSDAQHFTKAASYEMEAVSVVVDSLSPQKDQLQLNGQTIPGQDRVAQALKILTQIIPQLDKIEPSLHQAGNEVVDIDVNKYPENFGSTLVRQRIEEAKGLIVGIDQAVSQNRSLIEQAPQNLGQDSPKTYLLLFQNDKELRATGGFITAYAFLKLDKGHLSTTSSDDIYSLDQRLLQTCLTKVCPLKPPDPIVKYLPETSGKPRTAWSLRDSNLSPDFPTAAKQFETMYDLINDSTAFDGIVAIDTNVVKDLISITGPIQVFGTSYSADTDSRCNCSNVIYELEDYAEIASRGEPNRKAILGELMQQLLARSLGTDPQKLPSFMSTAINLANHKDILIYMHDPKTQQALSQINWAGEVKPSPGDYLLVNESNFAGGKSNLYVDEKVTLNISLSSTGAVDNKLTIEYSNPQPFSSWLNGILRDYIRIYVPAGSKLVTSKGSDDPVNTLEDQPLGKTYFEGFIQVRPQNSRVLSFEYTLPSNISGKNFQLLLQKQPGAKNFSYTVQVNNHTISQFNLTQDQLINISL